MSGLFWKDRTRAASKAEAERFKGPEGTGRRVAVALRAWLVRAIETLPPEARALYRIDPEPPEWFDPAHPHLVVGECERLVSGIPDASPGWIEWTPDQARAVGVLHAAREAVKVARGVPAPQALLILERSIDLGIQAARAHVEPWEASAATGHKVKRAAREGHRETHGTPEQRAKRHAELQRLLEEIRRRSPALSLTEARRRTAKTAGVSFSTVKRHTSDPGG